jgi:hypothetical protein
LKDADSINSTRFLILRRLQTTGLSIEVGTGGRTKYNRIKKKLPKSSLRSKLLSLRTYWLDAACVGASTPETIEVEGVRPLSIIATGHGSRQMCRMDKHGFPRTSAKQFKRVHGFQTGDIIKAIVPTGKKAGTYIGCVAVRTSGSFNLNTFNGTIQGINYRYCHLLQLSSGYNYKEGGTALP